jgi:hypothetical protein
MPVLKDYENFANTQLQSLIGETAPAASELIKSSGAAAKQYQDEYLPASSDYLKSATQYDTPERRALERGKAMTDVAVAGDAARTASLERLESYGIDPSMTRGAALDQNIRLDTALAQAKAANDKEMQVEDRGRAFTRDALDQQSGLSRDASGMSATGANILNSNNQAGNERTRLFADVFGTPNTNLRGQQDAQNSKLDAFKWEKTAKQAAKAGEGTDLSGIGALAGTLGGAYLGSFAGPGGAMEGAKLGGAVGGQVGGSASGY